MPILRNGAEVPFPTIITTMMSLDALWERGDEGVTAVFELHRFLENPYYTISETSRSMLIRMGLLRNDVSAHADTAAVVLSNFVVDGVDFRRVYPLAESSMT